MNWPIGAMYCSMPTVLRGSRAAAAPNSRSGTAVITPEDSSNRKCPVPSEVRVICPWAPSSATATSASGVIMAVSPVRVISAG